ncbi:MAG: iron ABC transporter permease [Pseudomonadota bacterium]
MSARDDADAQIGDQLRFAVTTAVLISCAIALIVLSQGFGAASASFADLWVVLTRDEALTPAQQVIADIRLPRALLGAVVGVHFAIAGLIMQSLLRNPLADPGVLGVSSGASLAVVISILVANTLWADPERFELVYFPSASIPFIALVGGLCSAALVLWMSWDRGLNPQRMALAGVVTGTIINALILVVIVGFGAGRAEMAILWLAGTLFGRGYENLQAMLGWTMAALFILPALARPLSLLRFGEDFARTMGLPVGIWRVVAALVAIGLTASAVSAAGPIGFVGLVVPHIARLLIGGNMAHLIVVSALVGLILTVGTDLVGRALFVPLEIPVGIITSLIGVPVFLVILQRNLWRLS